MLTIEELKTISKHKNFSILRLSNIYGLSNMLVSRKAHTPVEGEVYYYNNINFKILLEYLNLRKPKLDFNYIIKELNKPLGKRGRKEIYIKLNIGDYILNIGKIISINKKGNSTIYLILNDNNEYVVKTKYEINKILRNNFYNKGGEKNEQT